MAVSTLAKVKPVAGPKTLDILIKALEELDERKGVSIQAIKNYIVTNYPDRDPLKVKTSLRKAIQKGFDDDLLVRPKTSEVTGAAMTGRLKLNKAKMAEKEKSAKLKEKAKTEKKVVAKKPAVKKTTKAAADKSKTKPKAVKKTPTKNKKTTKEVKTPVKKTKKETKALKPAEKAKAMKTPKTPLKAKQTKAAKSKGKA